MNYNRTDSSLFHGGPVDVYNNNGTVAEQLWEAVHNIIAFSPDMMRPFLAAMGVKTEDMTPFCRKFNSLRDLRDTFITYCPNTFRYKGIVGRGLRDTTVNLEVDGNDIITSDHVVAKIRRIASDLLDSESALGDGAENGDGDGDGVGVDVDTIPLTETSSSNAQLPSYA